MSREWRGLRFAFDARAEIAAEGAPKTMHPARVTELSLQGCFLETAALFAENSTVRLKICESGDSFEAEGLVLYGRASGVGVVFREIQPQHRNILQKWILRALDNQLAAVVQIAGQGK